MRYNLTTTALTERDRESWFGVADDVVAHAAFLRTRAMFEGSWRPVFVAALVGVMGITLFSWGANPPEEDGTEQVLEPTPLSAQVMLTEAGREALGTALGGRACAGDPIEALVIGGTPAAPKVVTLPHGSCKAAQFVLPSDWGAATRAD